VAPQACYVDFFLLSQCETSARLERPLFPSSEIGSPKALTRGYIPMTDVYDKYVIHIFLHMHWVDSSSDTRTDTPTLDQVNDSPKEIIHCYGFHKPADVTISKPFAGLSGFIIGGVSLCSDAREDGRIGRI